MDENSASDGESKPSVLTQAGSIARACDNCRARKIRCDKNQPCSSCKANNSFCRITPIQKPQKQRVLISSQYEKKIDRIEDRLAGIERSLLRVLAVSKFDSSDTPESLSSAGAPESVGAYHEQLAPVNSMTQSGCAGYEEDKTLQEHSAYATVIVEQALDKSAFVGQSPEINVALASLRNIVNHIGAPPTGQEALISMPGANREASHSEIQLPWQQDVTDVIQGAKRSPSMTFQKFLPFMPLSKFEEICRDVYRQNGKVSQGRLVLFFGACYHLAIEYSRVQKGHSLVRKFEQLASDCRRNYQIVLGKLNLLMPATMENVQALLLGGTHGVELAKPSVCWIFNSLAANICQSLGFHRIETMKEDSEEEKYQKQSVFWFVYTMDKNTALRLGRASAIQDFDISIPRPELGSKWQMLGHWVRVGEVQGMIYEHLYSPSSFKKSDRERKELAQWILSRLDDAYSEASKFNERMGTLPDFLDLIRLSDAVKYHTLCCFIYRATPQESTTSAASALPRSPALSHECNEAARKALQAHLECAGRFKGKNNDLWQSYNHWAILNAPFTPFMILFCNVITTYNLNDLSLLADFTESLHSPPENDKRPNSEGAEKMYRLCHVFHQVAKLYVEAKAREAEHEEAQRRQVQPSVTAVGINELSQSEMGLPQPNDFQWQANELNPYLNALGFMPGVEYSGPAVPVPAQPDVQYSGASNIAEQSQPMWSGVSGIDYSFNSTTGIQDWFSGNTNIMGLLEQDLDFGPWQ